MNTILTVFKCAALACFCTLCIFLTVLARTTTKTVAKLDTVVTDTDSVVKRVGLIEKQTEYLIQNAGLAANQARLASLKEAVMLDSVNSQVALTLGNLNQFIVSSRTGEVDLLETTRQTVQGVQPVLAQSQIAVEQLKTTLYSVNKLVSDPALPATLANVQATTAATTVAMSNVSSTTADIKQVVRNYLHPSWPHRIFSWGLAVVHALNPL